MKKALLFLITLVILSASFVAWAATRHDNVIFAVDVSGSVVKANLVDIERDILSRMNAKFPGYVKSSGIELFGAHHPKVEWLEPIGAWDRAKFEADVAKIKPCCGGITLLGHALMRIQEKLEGMQGRTAVVVLSDGGHDAKPLCVVREIKKKYGDKVCIFIIDLKRDRAANDRGRDYLEQLAKVAGCGKYVNVSELSSDEGIQALVDEIFPPEAVAPPPPPPPPPAVDGDADNDGVPDSKDACPGTPKGVKVDERGCWVIKNLKFDSGSAVIKPEYDPELENILDVLQQNPDLKIEIGGHTDSQGAHAANVTLSERRAKAVADYLTGKGIAADRLSAVGYGPDKPVGDNATAEGRAENRRIEIGVK